MSNKPDCEERLKQARELWLWYMYAVDRKHGESEQIIRDMDRILGLTEADHDRWREEATAEEQLEAEEYERNKRESR